MKKLTQLLGVFATVVISATTVSGCSSTPDAPVTMSTAGTGGAGTAGSTGAGGGTQLTGAAAYTLLKGADATPSAMPAPAGWMSGQCYVCHGANGEGVMGIGPEIRHVPATYAQWVVRHGRPAPGGMLMIAFPMAPAKAGDLAINDADLAAVVAWLDAQPKPTTGVGLYQDFCGNCHGPTSASGGIVPVSIIGKMATQITQKVRMGEGTDPAMRNGFMPPEDMTALTDAELALIQTYLMAK